MTANSARKLVTEVFEKIERSKTIEELNTISDEVKIPLKNRFSTNSYPKIHFKIDASEVNALEDIGCIKNGLLSLEAGSSNKLDTLTKLLYALAWKNGDLKKIKHIIAGIKDSNSEDDTNDEALVFYQFGKFLTKTSGQPIIDQHVIRSFAVYKCSTSAETERFLKLGTLTKEHKPLIIQYKKWIISHELTEELKKNPEYLYYIDKTLFELGKTIKSRK